MSTRRLVFAAFRRVSQRRHQVRMTDGDRLHLNRLCQEHYGIAGEYQQSRRAAV